MHSFTHIIDWLTPSPYQYCICINFYYRPEPEPEVIILRPVERAHHVPKAPEEEQPEPPKFTHPMRDIDIVEGTRAHFEAKVTPLGDATMNIEWLLDGKPLSASKFCIIFWF